jgi:hypothetical protein
MERGGAYTFGGGKGSRAGSGRSLLRIALSVADARRERVTIALEDLVKLFDQSGGFFVSQVNVHDPDIGSRMAVAKARTGGLPVIRSPIAR